MLSLFKGDSCLDMQWNEMERRCRETHFHKQNYILSMCRVVWCETERKLRAVSWQDVRLVHGCSEKQIQNSSDQERAMGVQALCISVFLYFCDNKINSKKKGIWKKSGTNNGDKKAKE